MLLLSCVQKTFYVSHWIHPTVSPGKKLMLRGKWFARGHIGSGSKEERLVKETIEKEQTMR